MNDEGGKQNKASVLIRSLLFTLVVWISILGTETSYALQRERRLPRADKVLEITFPDDPQPQLKTPIFPIGRGAMLIQRQRLPIIDLGAAEGFTALDIVAEGEADAIKVRISIIYNDLSNQEWWKDKKEKSVGTYLVREGEAVRVAEVAQFGIQPFEMKMTSVKPVTFKPGEGPRIINNTRSLEVASIEKSADRYTLSLKNVSGKNIIAFSIRSGNSGAGSESYPSKEPLLPPEAIYQEIYLRDPGPEEHGITIRAVVFDDGTFEGDVKYAVSFFAKAEGMRIQAPSVLAMIEQALRAEDAELQEAFEKLETDLWKIPEAIDKQSAVDLLKSKYSSLGERDISSLYEELKGGLYRARNHALSPLGDMKRRMKESNPPGNGDDEKLHTARRLRDLLMRLKEDFERMAAKQPQ
jgi:hypothetical protein